MNNQLNDVFNPETAELISPPADTGDGTVNGEAPLEAIDFGTDLDASLRFADQHANVLKHCAGLGWFSWDGRRWQSEGAEGQAIELAKKSARSWLLDAINSRDEQRSAKIKAAMVLEGAAHIRAAVSLAASDPRLSVPAGDLDCDQWSLNVMNGTLDLRNGTLRPHRREDLITKLAPATYIPNARHPVLERYLQMLDVQYEGISHFLSRVFGMSLTGDAEAESLFLIQGDAGSGKTTLLEAIAAMLGDYSVKMNFESFCQSKHGRSAGSASPDLMPLRGSRLAYASEGEPTARLNDGKVKELTGNEAITARALYSPEVTFDQTWKIHLVTNYDPSTESDDSGIWRRMVKIPFNAIPEAQRDPQVKSLLVKDPDAPRSALLAWALAGCLDWQQHGKGRNGLAIPIAVQTATDNYRAKQDRMAEWWDDLLSSEGKLSGSSFTKKSHVRGHYAGWCRSNDCYAVSPQKFSAYLQGKGLIDDRNMFGRIWRGIELAMDSPDSFY
jgi:putative DNA primase/helicase